MRCSSWCRFRAHHNCCLPNTAGRGRRRPHRQNRSPSIPRRRRHGFPSLSPSYQLPPDTAPRFSSPRLPMHPPGLRTARCSPRRSMRHRRRRPPIFLPTSSRPNPNVPMKASPTRYPSLRRPPVRPRSCERLQGTFHKVAHGLFQMGTMTTRVWLGADFLLGLALNGYGAALFAAGCGGGGTEVTC
jgi:hypothetical protein